MSARPWIAAALLAAAVAAWPSVAAASPQRPPAAERAPRVLPDKVAERAGSRRARRTGARTIARAATAASYRIEPSTCKNSWISITQPYMWGAGSDYNVVSVQHAMFKLENGVWNMKAWSDPAYARAIYTRTNPGTAWSLSNGTREPSSTYAEALEGFGQYRMAHYFTWYDAYGYVAGRFPVWGKHYNFGYLADFCDLWPADGGIQAVNYG